MLGWLALIVAALAGLFVLIQGPLATVDPSIMALVVACTIAILAGLYFAALKSQSNSGRRRVLGFVCIAICALGTGAWWVGIDRIAAAFSGRPISGDEPRTRTASSSAVSVLIRRNADGNFVTQGQLSGIDVTLLFDTGASSVMLKPTDAERSGIDIQHLSFTTPVETANGTVYAAPVRVRSISIGLLKVEDVEALVARPGSLNENLLGMSFLRRLTSYDMTGDFLTLRE